MIVFVNAFMDPLRTQLASREMLCTHATDRPMHPTRGMTLLLSKEAHASAHKMIAWQLMYCQGKIQDEMLQRHQVKYGE